MWAALVAQARTQTSRAETLPWTLSVVRLSDIEALAMAGGQVLISEYFVEQRLKTDDELAFVLAHEMAHSIARARASQPERAAGYEVAHVITRNDGGVIGLRTALRGEKR